MRVALEQAGRRLVAVGAHDHEDGQQVDHVRHFAVVADALGRAQRAALIDDGVAVRLFPGGDGGHAEAGRLGLLGLAHGAPGPPLGAGLVAGEDGQVMGLGAHRSLPFAEASPFRPPRASDAGPGARSPQPAHPGEGRDPDCKARRLLQMAQSRPLEPTAPPYDLDPGLRRDERNRGRVRKGVGSGA
ncbi:hypothetical protein D3C86_1571740 [compost metagenome]